MTAQGRALLIDDSESDLELVRQHLLGEFPEYDLETYTDPAEFWRTVQTWHHAWPADIAFIVTDVYMLAGYNDVRQLARRLSDTHWSLRRSALSKGIGAKHPPVIAYSKFVEFFTAKMHNSGETENDLKAVHFVSRELASTLNFLTKRGIPLVPKNMNDWQGSLERLTKQIRSEMERIPDAE